MKLIQSKPSNQNQNVFCFVIIVIGLKGSMRGNFLKMSIIHQMKENSEIKNQTKDQEYK